MNKQKNIKYRWAKFFFILVCLPFHSVFASDLVDVEWLKKNTDKVKIIDVREQEKFDKGHIPQAINIPLKRFMRQKGDVHGFVIAPTLFKELMQQSGVSNDDVVVLYSDWSFLSSMRVYWIFDFYGHTTKKVLDGGFWSWIEAGFDTSLEPPVYQPSNFVVEINPEIITTKFRAFMASQSDRYVIVDGRNKKDYDGLTSLTSRRGHIPNAINLPWVDLVKNRDEEDGYEVLEVATTLEDLSVLKEKLALIPRDKKIILYCNGGLESSVLYFALKEIGVSSSLYDGSWYEWSSDQKMPIQVKH